MPWPANRWMASSVNDRKMRVPSLLAAIQSMLIAVVFAGPVEAQRPQPSPSVAPSGRVTTSVSFDGRVLRGGTGWFLGTPAHSGPSRMIIDYGQPHARGRTIFGGLVPYGEVWRLGANWATNLALDVPMRIGDLELPRGEYTLFLLPREDGGELVVSEETRQWGTDYDPSRDFGRTSVDRRDLSDFVQSLAITLEPVFPQEDGSVPAGTLRITWGEAEYSTDWQMIWR
jgi:hypothetical protein